MRNRTFPFVSRIFEIPFLETNKNTDIFIDKEFLITVNTGKKGIVKLNKNSDIGKKILKSIKKNKKIEFR